MIIPIIRWKNELMTTQNMNHKKQQNYKQK